MKILDEKYRAQLNKHLDIELSVFEPHFLDRVLSTRMLEKSVFETADYVDLLLVDEKEQSEFLNILNNSFSEFFRNPLTFSYIEQIVLPFIVEKKKTGNEKELRIWSAACAGGQEAYSIAMICEELFQNNSNDLNYRIFATDHSITEITKSKTGAYYPTSLNKVTFSRVARYFKFINNQYIINKNIKHNIDFSVFDLLSNYETSPPASIYGDFDLIFCSNVFFYYKPEYQRIILNKLRKSLSKDGYLIIGETEREIAKENHFVEVFPNSAIFQKDKALHIINKK